MKICILGAGNQGCGLGALLAKEGDVEEIILADRSIDIAQKAKSRILSMGQAVQAKSLKAVAVDAKDTAATARAAKGADVIFNGILPAFNIPVMRACIEVKAHYMDLYSMPFKKAGVPFEETIDAQFGLGEDFRKSGITAFPAVGICPGWSTMAAKHLIDQFDSVEEMQMRTIDRVETQTLVAPVLPSILFYHWLAADPAFYKDGQLIHADLIDDQEIFEFPEPIGKRWVYPEAGVADYGFIPRFAGKPIGLLVSKGAVEIGKWGMKEVCVKALRHLVSRKEKIESQDLFEILGACVKTEEDVKGLNPNAPVYSGGALCNFIEAIGMQGHGKYRQQISIVTEFETAVTHIPWANHGVYATIGAIPVELILMLGRGLISQKGVASVCELEDINAMIQRVSKRGHKIIEHTEKLS